MNRIKVDKDGWNFIEEGTGQVFRPLGCNYYDPETGWAPKLWQKYDRMRVESHFARMKELGINIARVFLTIASFMTETGAPKTEGVDKARDMLDIAERHGIRVIFSGPGGWEGIPDWFRFENGYEIFGREDLVQKQAAFWVDFTHMMRDYPALFSIDLHNEPSAPYRQTEWLRGAYANWRQEKGFGGEGHIPSYKPWEDRSQTYDFEMFREEIGTNYIKRMVEAIKSSDPDRMVSIGLHQKSAPFDWYPPDPWAAFNPHKFGDVLDYISLHYYSHHFFHPNLYPEPLSSERAFQETITHCRAIARYLHVPGKPLVIEECGQYGGGYPLIGEREQAYVSQADQARWNKALVMGTSRDVVGWLFWPYQDTKSSLDASRYSGFLDFDGRLKEWGKTFMAMAPEITGVRAVRSVSPGISVKGSMKELLTNIESIKNFRAQYLEAFDKYGAADLSIVDLTAVSEADSRSLVNQTDECLLYKSH